MIDASNPKKSDSRNRTKNIGTDIVNETDKGVRISKTR
jgi:hypothetical protein